MVHPLQKTVAIPQNVKHRYYATSKYIPQRTKNTCPPKKKKKSNVCCNIICNSQNVEIIRNHSVTNNGTYQGPIIGRCIEGEKAHRAFIPRGEDRKY